MEHIDYVSAGYDKRESERPIYPSSTNFMLFQAGAWCRDHNITPLEARPGRGYKIIINRSYVLDFKKNDYSPLVTRQ